LRELPSFEINVLFAAATLGRRTGTAAFGWMKLKMRV
jgi:hypothetical protein